METFQTTLLAHGKTATGIEVPADVITGLGAGRRPAVRVTIGGHTYRSTVAPRGERYLLGVSAENRERAGVAAGDELDVTLELDTAPREVQLPSDFAAALDDEPAARRCFEGLPYSQRSWFVLGIEEAKRPETRQRRIDKAVERLAQGRGQR